MTPRQSTIPILVVPCCLVVILAAAPKEEPEPDWVKPLLAQVKLTSTDAQLDKNRWKEGGKAQLTVFQRLWDDWRRVDPTARDTAVTLLDADNLDRLATRASSLIDIPPLPPGGSKPVEPGKAPSASEALVRAIVALQVAARQPLPEAKLKELTSKARSVPAKVGLAAATVLNVIPAVLQKREQSLKKLGGPDKHQAAYQEAIAFASSYRVNADTLLLMSDVDLTTLMHGGQELARAVDRATAALASVPAEQFEFSWDTPLGTIILNGNQENSYSAGPYLLLLDTGGNDRYLSGAGTSDAAHPVSVLLDLSGNDHYEAKGVPAFGAGILGYGMLIDAGGDDTYIADRAACGFGAFGMGLLLDRAGKDRYTLNRLGQGAAYYGVGVLADRQGNDEYRCYQIAQGLGGARGCGALVDRAGADVYEANDKDIRHPSPQDPKHNTSLAQGCGWGRRAHFPGGDGHSLAGGVGVLADGGGDDQYSCGLFGQGVAYWYGLGMLVDLDGNDNYRGVWYCQGSAAHYAVGALCDLKGNDSYHGLMTMCQGSGHDFGTAWLHDGAGDDRYECPGNCLGFSLYNSVGVLWDEGGADIYLAQGAAFGQAGEARPESLTLGLFIDQGGKAEFPKTSPAKPNSVWTQAARPGQRSFGVGMAR